MPWSKYELLFVLPFYTFIYYNQYRRKEKLMTEVELSNKKLELEKALNSIVRIDPVKKRQQGAKDSED